MTWENEKPDNHFWAFYYFCKNRGDSIELKHNKNGTKNLTIMPKGKDSKSTYRTNEASKRLAQYKKDIEKGLNHYKGDKDKFIKNFAHYILAEVRNERQLVQEFIDKLEESFIEFEPDAK